MQSVHHPPETPPVISVLRTVKNEPTTPRLAPSRAAISESDTTKFVCPAIGVVLVAHGAVDLDRLIWTPVVVMVRLPLMILASITVFGSVIVIGPE